MTKITRSNLIKSIVAEEMRTIESEARDNGVYVKALNDTYASWEHKSSDELCLRYNKINNNTVTVSMLAHDA